MGKDSSELLWDDINRPKFYTLLTAASAAIRICLYPAALVKTRLQAGGGPTTTAPTTVPAAPARAAPSGMAALHPSAVSSGGVGALTHMPLYRGTGDAFRTILRTEGKFALYRGFRMNLLGLACDPLVIGCIEFTRTHLTFYSERFTPLKDGAYEQPVFRYLIAPSTAITIISAGGSACVGQIIQVPVDVISQKKQMQMHALQTTSGAFTRNPTMTSMAIAQQIVRTEGLRGLYRGFGITLCSATPFTSILWAVYWPTQRFLLASFSPAASAQVDVSASTPPPGVSAASPPFSASMPPSSAGLPIERHVHPPGTLTREALPKGAKLSREDERYLEMQHEHEHAREWAAKTHQPAAPIAAGGFFDDFDWRKSIPTPIAALTASAAASLLTQPIDVLKTRLQVGTGASPTLKGTVKALLRERGLIGLMSGWYPRILAVSPQSVIMMSSYEALKRYCQK